MSDKLGFSKEYYLTNNGDIFFYVYEGKLAVINPKSLYRECINIMGFNAVRVGIDKDIAFRYNRECLLFFDDKGELLEEWYGRKVIPILNCPVQMRFNINSLTQKVKTIKDKLVYSIDVKYPHPYRNKGMTAYYDGSETYQAKEIYLSLLSPNDEGVIGLWYRKSSWLPWMQLRNHEYFDIDTKLIFSTKLYRLENISDVNGLNPYLKHFIINKIDLDLPLYPTDESNMTSLIYFQSIVDSL